MVLYYRLVDGTECLSRLLGFVGRGFLGLTYHVGVNTVSKPISGYSPIIGGVGYWVPLPRGIDLYRAYDLVYVVDGAEKSLASILSKPLVSNVLEIRCSIDRQGFHIDPDFYTGSYGEYWKYRPIEKLLSRQGAVVLFFIGSFREVDSGFSRGFWGLFGHMYVDEYISIVNWGPSELEEVCSLLDKYGYNAHIVRSLGRRVLDVVGREDMSCREKLEYILGGRQVSLERIVERIKEHARLLLKARHYCIYKRPFRIWGSRDGLYGRLYREGVIVKQVLYSRVYTLVDAWRFIEWILGQ